MAELGKTAEKINTITVQLLPSPSEADKTFSAYVCADIGLPDFPVSEAKMASATKYAKKCIKADNKCDNTKKDVDLGEDTAKGYEWTDCGRSGKVVIFASKTRGLGLCKVHVRYDPLPKKKKKSNLKTIAAIIVLLGIAAGAATVAFKKKGDDEEEEEEEEYEE